MFYQTYREFFDLITLAEMKGGITTADLPGSWRGHVFRAIS